MILSWIVSMTLKSKFTKYSKIPLDNGMSGREVAEKMLRDNGITGVKIESVEGQLTDHYNPADKTINLSREVYEGRSISSAAVAAHETRTCSSACESICMAWIQISLGSRSQLYIEMGTMDLAGRYTYGKDIPCFIAGRNSAVCSDDHLQFHNTSG